MAKMKILDWVAISLLIIGGINWGLFGLFKIDLVKLLFGSMTLFARVIYSLVGLSAVYSIYSLFKLAKRKR